jgi:polysaccharide biosynthesis transport protein
VRQLLQLRENELGVLRVELSRVLGRSTAGIGSEQLQSLGQLSGTEVSLVNNLIETQLNLDAAQVRRQSLGQAYVEAQSQLKQFPALLSKYGSLQPDIVAKRETLQQLLKAQQDIEIELARQGFEWQVIEQPQLGVQLGPDLKKNLLLAMVAGGMLGGMAAFAREAMDDSVHTSEDLQKQVAAPLLGVVPEVKGLAGEEEPLFALPFQKQRALPSSVSEMMQWHDFREALDLLYQNLQLLQGGTPLKSLVITSALAGEGKSTVALGLAMSAARLHQRVLLIDADLRNPTLHTRLGLPNDKGLSNFLVERGMVPQELLEFAEGDRTGISVLTSGPVVGDPAKLLSSHRLRDVMTKFEENYDLVIVDTSPVLGMVDTLLTASCCQGTLMVGKVDRVKKGDLTAAMGNLRALNLMGLVANGVPSGRKAYAGSLG